ncbi:hypothetical protein ACNHUS_23230 [Actinomycetes bacterium M1A6_2h]
MSLLRMPSVHSLNSARSLLTFCGAVGIAAGVYALAVWRFVTPFDTDMSVGPGLVDGGILIENPSILPAAAVIPAITIALGLFCAVGLGLTGYHLTRGAPTTQSHDAATCLSLVAILLWLGTYPYLAMFPPVLPRPTGVSNNFDVTVPQRLPVGPDWLVLAVGLAPILLAALVGLRLWGYRFARSDARWRR